MILHHVADGSRLVVESGAALDAELFRHADLDALHVVAIPDRFEQRVGKAKEQHVVHGLLPEIMVDAENSLFVERAKQNPVEPLRTEEVRPEWLLHDDARPVRDAAGLILLLHHGAEQHWRNRKVKRWASRGA